jgi:preprotein translocase subunit SecE
MKEGEVADKNRRRSDDDDRDDRLDQDVDDELDAVDDELDAVDDETDDEDDSDDDLEDAASDRPGRSRGRTASATAKAKAGAVARTKSKDGKSVGIVGRLVNFVREVFAELQKVIWPTRKELLTYTTVVIVFVTIMLTFVGLLDLGFARAMFFVFGSKGNN